MNIWLRRASQLLQAPHLDGNVVSGNGFTPPSNDAEPDDFALIASAQKGETRAYDQLVLRHRNRIFAMIRNMTHNEADAWDLSQDVFIKAWNALASFESKAKFSTWLFRIAHNVVYDWNRRRKREPAGELNDELLQNESIDPCAIAIPRPYASPDIQMEHSELKEKIETALRKVSHDQRQIILLKDVQGLSYKEIADVTGCEIGTVMSRLFYARKKLQTLLKDEYEAR
jgi:RNA polymerase sigma-70 factor (ECF subfamily)